MIVTVVRAAAEGAAHNPLLPHTYDLVWGIITFLPFLALFLFFVMPRFNVVLDERSEKIEQGLKDAEEAKESLARAQQDADAVREEARREASEIRTQAKEEARRIVSQAKQDATAEAQRVTEVAQAQIKAEREAAVVGLRADVGSLAADLAEKIVGEHLQDQALTDRVVDRFLDDLEKELTTQEA